MQCAGSVPVITSTGGPPLTPTGPPTCAPGFQPPPGMFPGGLPHGQPFIMVPAGAQPPQVNLCPKRKIAYVGVTGCKDASYLLREASSQRMCDPDL